MKLFLLLSLFFFPPPDIIVLDNVEYILDAEVYINQMSMAGNNTVSIVYLIPLEKKRINNIPQIKQIYLFQKDKLIKIEPHSFKIREQGFQATGRSPLNYALYSWVNVMVEIDHNGTLYYIGRECVKVEEVY